MTDHDALAVLPLTFAEFARVNRERCEAPDGFGHPLDGWSLSDWMLAATGEFGEAANVAKKLNRVRDGIPGNTQTPEELEAALADEFADAVIYLDLAAQSRGIDLGAAIASKFNRTSEKIGAPHRLAAGVRVTGDAGLRSALKAIRAEADARYAEGRYVNPEWLASVVDAVLTGDTPEAHP